MLAVQNLDLSVPQNAQDTKWLRYFDPRKAVASVYAHIAALPSSRTPERHTLRAYEDGLKYWLSWAGDALPSEELVTAYIAHLKDARGLKSSTIGSKYLAPLRLYLRKLAAQPVAAGDDWYYITTCREHFRAAAAVKTPPADTVTNVAPLWRAEFTRLNRSQVNAVLRAIDRRKLSGLRDYALLMVAFSTGLRLAELQRITPESFRLLDVWTITVRGKRSNMDPVPIGPECRAAVSAYIEVYNGGLDDGDPRRIAAKTALWQPLLHGDHYAHVGVNHYDPARGMSQTSLREVIARRSSAALGAEYTLAAHDTRRTAAAIAYEAGMPLPDLQALLRHKNAAVTLHYVGTKPDLAGRALANYVKFG